MPAWDGLSNSKNVLSFVRNVGYNVKSSMKEP